MRSTQEHRITANELIRDSLKESLIALRTHRAGVTRLEAESIHQMRIGTRRSRAILHLFRPVMDEQWAEQLETELRWLARILGAVRDLDVMRGRLREAAKELSLNVSERRALERVQRILGKRHHAAQVAMLEGLRSERYRALQLGLHMGNLAPQLTLDAGHVIDDALFPHVKAAWKKLSRAGAKLERDDDPLTFHRVRKMAKRVRYVTESILPHLDVKGNKRATATIKQLKNIQETLGELQDAHVASITIEQIRETVTTNRASTFDMDLKRLLRAQQKSENSARRKFEKRWKAVKRLANHKWYD